MRRRSTTTELIVDASRMLQETVCVLFDPERGVAIIDPGHNFSRVAL